MELLRAMLVDFLVGWLEEGAGGLSWRRVWFEGEVLVIWLRFGEVWFDSVFVCLFGLFWSGWLAGWLTVWMILGRWIGRWIE